MAVLATITSSKLSNRMSRCSHRKEGLMTMPMLARNMAANRLRMGSTWCSVRCACSVLDIMVPATKAPISIDRPSASLAHATTRQKATTTIWKSSSPPERPEISCSARRKGPTALRDSSSAPARKSAILSARPAIAAKPPCTSPDPPSTGSSAKSTPTSTSWVTSVPMVICPYTVAMASRSAHSLSTTAVLDIERNAPMKTPSATGAPRLFDVAPIMSMSMPTCRSPPPTATPRTARSLAMENSSPRQKSSSTTPTWLRVSTCTSSLMTPMPPGPTHAPATR
mmetsp:Transcript_13162/g.55121  ORF Transcript_13162/g.55121 Transcript_13162/m.55121 type:complete len:282 (-) Transcript_13162:908-1753(-)